MRIDVSKNCLKATFENLVIYDRDYLLDNLAREIYLLENTRRSKGSEITIDDIKKGK